MTPLTPLRGKPGLYVTLLIITVAAMCSLKYCSHRDGMVDDRRAQGDTIEVAIEISPVSLSTSGDTLGGFYYDLMRRIAAAEGLNVKFTPFSQIESAMNGVEEGRYDMIIADLPATTSMKERFLLTDPITLDREVLVQLRDSVTGRPAAMTQNDLRGDTVWIPAGSPFRDRLINLSHEIGDTIYIEEDPDYASEQLLMLVAIGDIPAAVVNERIARSMAARYPRLDLSVDISFTQFQSWVVAKRHEALRDSLNVWLKRHNPSSTRR